MSLFTRTADLLDPPPPPPERATPSGFAAAYSRGTWQRARHLDLVEAAVLNAIDTGGNIILSVSVRHGKSQYGSKWLPAWYLGTHPDRRVILAGHEADFAATWGRQARDILTEYGPEVFGVRVNPRSEAANRWDIADHQGGMLTVGVGGSPIGRGGDLIIIDDPLKSWEAAMSPRVREKLVDWWTGTMESRREPGGAVVLICARWHEDDLAGFLLRTDPDNWTELRLPALCDDEAGDPMGRVKGEALWPERWPVTELEARRRAVSLRLGEQVWDAQYQQRPSSPEGGMFPSGAWTWTGTVPVIKGRWCRAWDLAATEHGGDFTVGALMGVLPDGRVIVADVVRGQWGSDRMRSEILGCAQSDPAATHIELPQDPGQAGKDQKQQFVRMLAGFDVSAQPVTGSKEIRAGGWSAQQRAGNVVVVEGPAWNGPLVAEHAAFPKGLHDDIVDAAATGYNWLVKQTGSGTQPWRPQGGRR